MRRLRAYLQLVRLPAVFTAIADIFLGFTVTRVSLSPAFEFLRLLASSSALYLAGMALNDVFDRKLDARERPNRPIPSGRVPVYVAIVLGAALLGVGVACARTVGTSSLQIAVLLGVLILAYDGLLKRTPLGPLAMGGCRLLNVMLGASTASNLWESPQVGMAVAMGVYVAGITWFAREEAGRSARGALIAATAILDAGLAGLAMIIWTGDGGGNRIAATAALFAVAGFIHRRVIPALREPDSRTVQSVVKRSLLMIILLDATMIYSQAGSLALACLTAVLIVPAAALGRWIFIT